jgi:hypothetical protein
MQQLRASNARFTNWQNNFLDAVEDKLKLGIKLSEDQKDTLTQLHREYVK